MDWIGLAFAVPLVAVTLWCLYLYGSFEMTGARGWRRIWAGWKLLIDQIELRLHRWAVQARRRRVD